MFSKFSEKSIKVMMLAQEEARRLGFNFVGTDFILLGLIGEGKGYAAKALIMLGVNLKDARVEVEKIVGKGSGFVSVEIPYTPRVKRVLGLAWQEANELKHKYIGTEHLLLGILQENEGVAARVLENLGVDPDKLKLAVLSLVKLGEGKDHRISTGKDLDNTINAGITQAISFAKVKEDTYYDRIIQLLEEISSKLSKLDPEKAFK